MAKNKWYVVGLAGTITDPPTFLCFVQAPYLNKAKSIASKQFQIPYLELTARRVRNPDLIEILNQFNKQIIADDNLCQQFGLCQ